MFQTVSNPKCSMASAYTWPYLAFYSLVLAMKMTHTFWDCATIVYGCSAVCCSVCKCKAIMWHDQVLNNNNISASQTQSKFRWVFWLFVLELITLEWSYEPEMRANSICLVFYDWDTWCTATRAQNRNILTMCDTRLSQQTWML